MTEIMDETNMVGKTWLFFVVFPHLYLNNLSASLIDVFKANG